MSLILRTLLMLVPFLMLNTEGGGAAGGEGGEGGATGGQNGNGGNEGQQQGQSGGEGQPGQSQGTGSNQRGTNDGQPSANKLIKDFAAQRGITVEALLSSYEELENAGKTELEKLNGERDRYKSDAERLTGEIRDLRAESVFSKAATDAGALDAETLFMAYKARLEFDKDGKPTNVADVVNDLKKTKPSLFKPATGTSDAGRQGDSPGGGKADMNDFIRGLATDARAKR